MSRTPYSLPWFFGGLEPPGPRQKGTSWGQHLDSLEELPLSERRLRLFTGYPDLPPDYAEERPRIIDVWHPVGAFSRTTNCSELRVMDAIVTILYSYDPKLLDRVSATVRSESDVMSWKRITGPGERFDIVIEHRTPTVSIRVYEKVRMGGRIQKRSRPYISASYDLRMSDVPETPHREGWYVWHTVADLESSDEENGDPSEPSSELLEYRNRCFARYLLLSKPWEMNPDVMIRCTVQTKEQWLKSWKRSEEEERTCDWPIPEQAAGKRAYRALSRAEGNPHVERDPLGWPSRADEISKIEQSFKPGRVVETKSSTEKEEGRKAEAASNARIKASLEALDEKI